MKVFTPVKLEGERVIIRTYEDSDAEAVYAAINASRKELGSWLTWCTDNFTAEDARKWVTSRSHAWLREEEFSFIIVEKSTGNIIGAIGLNLINRTHGFANMGYWMSSSCAGKGYTSEAAKVLAAYALKHLDLNRIEILADVDNIGSKKVAEKSGAKFEGILRQRINLHNSCHDAALYSIIKSDLE